MANAKVSALAAVTAVSADDLLYVVDSPGGAAASKKVTFANLQGSLSALGKVNVTQPATGATLTLAEGSTLATAGAFSATFTATGVTNVTLPTTGTLATLAGTEALTNKSVNGLVVTPTLATLTLPNNASASFGTSGNFAVTLTATSATNVTLPTTGTLATVGGAETFTNKRLTPRIGTVASSATPAINVDAVDQFNVTALATNVTSFTTNLTGTPLDGQKLLVRILDNGSARTLAWGASFIARGVSLPTTTTAGKYLYVGFVFNAVTNTFDCIASTVEA